MQAIRYKDLSDSYSAVPIEAGKTIQQNFPELALEDQVILVNGKQSTPDYLVKEGDVIVLRSIPGASVVTVVLLAVALIGAAYTGYQAYQLRKQVERMQDAMKSVNDEVVAVPQLRGAQNQSAENRYVPYFIGRNFFTPYKLTDIWKEIPDRTFDWHKPFRDTLRYDELNHIILLCGYQKLLFESISTDDIRIKTFTDTSPQDGKYAADTDSPLVVGTGYPPQVEIYQSTVGTATERTIKKAVEYTPLNMELKKADNPGHEDIILTLPRNSMGTKICMQFNGLRQYEDDGSKKLRELVFNIKVSYDGGTTWVADWAFVCEDKRPSTNPWLGNFSISHNTKNQFYKTLRFSPSYAKVKSLTDPVMLKVTCVTDAYEGQALDSVGLVWMTNELYDTDLSAAANNFVRAAVIDTPEYGKSCLLRMRVQATQSIEDKFDKINIIASGVARTWNGTVWSTGRYKTSNPAAWLLEVLTSTVHSPSKCTDAELDLDAFGELYEYCTTNELECNMVITEGDTKENILKKICSTCFASLYRSYTGKISVVYDDVRENAIAVFNTQNVISFKNRKDLSTITDGVRVTYIESQTWKQDAALVMRPGKTRDGTAIIRDLSIDGVTNYDQAVFIARRIMAQELYREKETTIRVGREGAFYTPLAKVLVQHPSLKIGLGSSEIKSVIMSGTNMTGLVLYDPIEYQSAYADGYGMIIQCIADTYCTPLSKQYTAIADGMAKTIAFTTPINTLTAPAIPHAGDILSYGYLNSGSFDTITSPMLITGIDRDDTGYVLSLVDYNEDIYTTGAYPTYTPNITQPTARGFTQVTTVPTMEDVVSKVEEAKSPITVSGIPIYVARKTCLANCEIDGVDYLLYETASGWEIVSINEDESFTSYLTGTGVMHDMCNHLGSIILAGSTGAWFVEADKSLTIIYDHEVTSIQSDGSNLWGVVGGQICQFNGTDGHLHIFTLPSTNYKKAFYFDGDYYCVGSTSSTNYILYKLVSGSLTAVYTDPIGAIILDVKPIGDVLYIAIGSKIYTWNGTGIDEFCNTLSTPWLLCSLNGSIVYASAFTVYIVDMDTKASTLYASVANDGEWINSIIEYNDQLVATIPTYYFPGVDIDIYTFSEPTGSTVQDPVLTITGALNPPYLSIETGKLIIHSDNDYIIDEQITTATLIAGVGIYYINVITNGERNVFTTEYSGARHIDTTYPYGSPTPIDATVRAYSKLRLLADHLYCGVTDGDLYRVDNDALVKLTDTADGYNAVAWRKDKIYAATDTAVYLVNDNGTVTAVENAVSATPIVELFVSGDYLIWCPTYATTGTLYAAFVEYTGSVNVWQDVTLYVPSDCPIGAVKTFRKMSAYSGTPVVITPPSGATFEGRASISLYGQYSYVILERISATVFAVVDLKDKYKYVPSTIITNLPGGWDTALGNITITKNRIKLTQVYIASGAATGTLSILINNIFPAWLTGTDKHAVFVSAREAGVRHKTGVYSGEGFYTSTGSLWNATVPQTWKNTDNIYFDFDLNLL